MKHRVIGFSSRATQADINCLILARLGFSYKLIQHETGLSLSQIKLRIKQSGSQIKKYRNGETILSHNVIENCTISSKILQDEIRHELKKISNSK